MASNKGGRRPNRGQRPTKGFRPGKEPAPLKKQMAKARLGSDATWVQKRTVEAIAGKSPQDVQKMVRKWSLGFVVAAVVLAVLGVFLYSWSLAAGVVVHVLTVVLLFLGYRIRKQGGGLAALAESF